MKIHIPTQEELHEFMTRGIERIYPNEQSFQDAIRSGKRLTIYNGIDPTASTMHIGHMIILKKLAQLQKWGHQVILLIGDFTAMIGDPSGKLSVRKKLTREEVLNNAKLYQKQASVYLDFDRQENPALIKYNSEWLDSLSFADVVELASEFTVSYMLERDMFQSRVKEEKPIFLHEFLYPLMQGYDSVAMNVDMELGGNDQTFNMLAGRDMQKRRGKEKFVMTISLLTDASGKKMGKTEGNMITLIDSAQDMYGKVMSWTDEMLVKGFYLCTDVSTREIQEMEKALNTQQENPMNVKKRLAREIVAIYHGEKNAQHAQSEFEAIFQAKERPTDLEIMYIDDTSLNIVDLLVKIGMVKSKAQAKRAIQQKGIKVNQQIVDSWEQDISLEEEVLIQKGKRHFAKVKKK